MMSAACFQSIQRQSAWGILVCVRGCVSTHSCVCSTREEHSQWDQDCRGSSCKQAAERCKDGSGDPEITASGPSLPCFLLSSLTCKTACIVACSETKQGWAMIILLLLCMCVCPWFIDGISWRNSQNRAIQASSSVEKSWCLLITSHHGKHLACLSHVASPAKLRVRQRPHVETRHARVRQDPSFTRDARTANWTLRPLWPQVCLTLEPTLLAAALCWFMDTNIFFFSGKTLRTYFQNLDILKARDSKF